MTDNTEVYADGNSVVIRRPKVQKFDPTTGKYVAATGANAITGTAYFAATEDGAAISGSVSASIAEEGTADGSYYAVITGANMQSVFANYPDGQALWEVMTSPAGYRSARRVVLRKTRRIVQP